MARILVLCGGDNIERRVSLASGDAVARGLARGGHIALKMDTAQPDKIVGAEEPLLDGIVGSVPPEELENARLSRGGWATLISTIDALDVDCVFPILHGGWGEDGRVQALLELIELPYLGSGVLSSQLCMNKPLTKEFAVRHGILCTDGFLVSGEMTSEDVRQRCERELHLPIVIKPACSGSAVDVFIVNDPGSIADSLDSIRNHGEIPLVEQYIAGKELTVTILGEKALPIIEIVPKTGLYDYTRKYTRGETEYLCPAPVDEELSDRIRGMSLDIFKALGCRHIARVDWRLSHVKEPFFLELNTIPGMTDLSLVPMAAAAVGIDFAELMNHFVTMTLNED